MGKGKKRKISELNNLPNTFQKRERGKTGLLSADGSVVNLKGKWGAHVFQNEQPITLELACGRGEYTLALAQREPDKNFIGVDVKGPRLWKAAKYAYEQKISNVAFARIQIENIEEYFGVKEISEIWITFPDPFPKKRMARRRLTQPRFLKSYRNICKENTPVHLKTDSDLFYDATLDVLELEAIEPEVLIKDVHQEAEEESILRQVCTYYEKMHLEENRKIKYLRFRL